MIALQILYALNIAILLPVALPTLLGLFPPDESRFSESPGWKMLVGAFWLSILVLSILGLWQPLRYSPVLLLQVIYKVIWLVSYAAPRMARGEASRLPRGITYSFIAIVLTWPFFIPWGYLLGR